MNTYFSELEAYVLLNRLTMGGGREVFKLLSAQMPAREIAGKILDENFLGKSEALQSLLVNFSPAREIENCLKMGIRLLTLLDSEYPVLLRQIFDPPILLYVQGDFLESDQAAVSIVGSRFASLYGLAQARKFGLDLASAGITVVSGLAKGIDQAAHEGALLAPYGRTLAVLGCGLDVAYPSNRKDFSSRIAERGAIISECALGTQPLAENFPRRNRIISGLSLAVLVVEARERSGSLITAREALEQGRDVFAIPGPVDQPGSRGTHGLIKEGATLVENALDILEQLAPQLWPLIPVADRMDAKKGLESDEKFLELDAQEKELLSVLADKSMAYDELAGMNHSNLSGNLLSALTALELKGRIQKDFRGFYKAVRA